MHHVAIAEKFELRRSPRAQVSQTIAAIDNHRPLLVENVLSLVQQLWERQVNGATYRGAAMLVRGQHVDDLAAAHNELQNLAMIYDPHT